MKFISALALTLVLCGLVIFSGYERDRRQGAAGRIDFEEVQSLVEAERLSLREAGFYEVIEADTR